MKDEYDNECPYDFKNIQFKRWNVTNVKAYYKNPSSGNYEWQDWENISGETHYLVNEDAYALSNDSIIIDENDSIWCYTFCGYSEGEIEELTVWQANNSSTELHCFNNVIKISTNESYDSTGNQKLNNICIIDNDGCGDAMKNNSFDGDCYNITVWGYYFSDNQFGCYNHDNTFGNNIWDNTFGNSVRSNTFGNEVYYNTFGNEVYYNTFGNNIWDNTFGNNIWDNTFGNDI